MSAPTGASTSRATSTCAPPRREGGKPRQKNELDRFDIDFSLCMYCGICVEVCPFEALFWSPEYEYSEVRIADLLHDKTRLGEWMETVPGLRAATRPAPRPRSRRCPGTDARCCLVAQNIAFCVIAAADGLRRRSGS